MHTNRWITTATAAATLLVAAGAAQALTVVKRQSGSGGNLLSNTCSFADGAADATVTGCLSTNPDRAVTLTSDESIGYGPGSPLRVRGTDSDYSHLSITVDDRAMKTLVMNLNATSDGYISFSDGSDTSKLFRLKGEGSNFFTIRGPFDTLSYTTYSDRLGTESDLIRDTRQVRFALDQPTPAIPEPSTYALMLAGFGVVGFMVRRRRRDREVA
ncbi:MAG TPA: PEPxxWA-CTERM sorting domain-containing protein [Methylibium sp.]|nr:PEPxxWA-CTERM sorting domain-containing protein [Methylibium sp.]